MEPGRDSAPGHGSGVEFPGLVGAGPWKERGLHRTEARRFPLPPRCQLLEQHGWPAGALSRPGSPSPTPRLLPAARTLLVCPPPLKPAPQPLYYKSPGLHNPTPGTRSCQHPFSGVQNSVHVQGTLLWSLGDDEHGQCRRDRRSQKNVRVPWGGQTPGGPAVWAEYPSTGDLAELAEELCKQRSSVGKGPEVGRKP